MGGALGGGCGRGCHTPPIPRPASLIRDAKRNLPLTDQRKWTRGRSRAGAWGLVSRHRLLGTIPDGAGVGQQDGVSPPQEPHLPGPKRRPCRTAPRGGSCSARGALAELPQCGRESSPDARVTGVGETPPSHGGQGSRPAQREPQGVYRPKKERSPCPPRPCTQQQGSQLQHRTPRPHCEMQPLLLFAKGLDPPPCLALSKVLALFFLLCCISLCQFLGFFTLFISCAF